MRKEKATMIFLNPLDDSPMGRAGTDGCILSRGAKKSAPRIPNLGKLDKILNPAF
jgi:hypothetical protein